MTVREKKDIRINTLALILIFTANVCFYTAEYLTAYRILIGIGIIIAFAANIKSFHRKVSINSFIIWLIIVYGMYMLYGFLRLRAGSFNGDVLVYRFFECVSFYLCISTIIRINYQKIVYPFVISGAFSLAFLIWQEGAFIIAGNTRIGDTLSGNVNTVGFNLGLISMILMWVYCIEKKKWHMLFFVVFIIFMLLTGSKKALIIIVFDFLLAFIYQREKASTWLKIAIVVSAGIYAIFNVPYLYNIIGIRIESMFLTLRYGTATAIYSYSTDMRDVLIKEGLSFFTEHPIFGGGYNYFKLRTITHYDYSHCNYIELLSNFGLVGTILFYSKHFSNLRFLYRSSKRGYKENTDLFRIAVIFIIQTLVLDWGAVTFSAQAVWYIPLIIASVATNQIRSNYKILAEGNVK